MRNTSNRGARAFIAIAFGAATALAQVLVLRAVLSALGGNEFAIGVGLCAWLTATGLAALVTGPAADRARHPDLCIAFALALLPVSTACGLFLADLDPAYFGAPVGALPTALQAFALVFLAMLPPALPAGALFAWLVRNDARHFGTALKRITVFEALGSAIGGLLLASALTDLLTARQWLWLLAAFSFPPAFLYARRAAGTLKATAGLLAMIGLAYAITTLTTQAPKHFLGYPVLEVTQGRSGRLLALDAQGQSAIFHGSSLRVDNADWESSDILQTLAAAVAPDDGDIWLLDGTLSDACSLSEIFPKRGLRLMQADADLVTLERKHDSHICNDFDSVGGGAMRLITTDDPRRSLRPTSPASTGRNPGLILLPRADSESIAGTRYLSSSFFRDAAARLSAPDGTLLLGLGSPGNYVSEPEALLLASLIDTARTAFPHCSFLPLDRYWLVCRATPHNPTAAALTRMAAKQGLTPKKANEAWLADALSPDRRAMLDTALNRARKQGASIMQDLHSNALFFYFTLKAGQSDTRHFDRALWLRKHTWMAAGFFLGLVTLLTWLARRSPRSRAGGLLAVAMAGGCGIVVEVAVMTAYQAGYGQLYLRLGALVASYLAGIGLGAVLAEWRLKNFETLPARLPARLLVSMTCWMGVVGLLLPLLTGRIDEWTATGLAALLLLGQAVLGGAIFQTTAQWLRERQPRGVGHSAGLLRAVDHGAAAVAALAVGLLALPLYGIPGTLGLCALVCLLAAGGFQRE